ncbi:MAG: nuclear transport factor 2 family protein [Candidatus Eiseniibacteriota bacterium]|jgi:ketosteroid isomerase-like protein
MPTDPEEVARRCFQAYADSDRAAIEALIGDPFRFTSPLDNGLDRAAYLERCWPNHERVAGIEFVHLFHQGDCVFVTYEIRSRNGRCFRNSEVLTVRDGKLVEVEVYFGWNVPHDAPAGGWVEPE